MNKLIKTLHVLSACLWLGASARVVLLQCLKGWSEDSRDLAVLNEHFAILDFALIIPGAMSSLVTGFLICKTTSWRFIRYWWVIAKWIGTLSGILVGTALLGPWQLQMVQFSDQLDATPEIGSLYDLPRVPFTVVGFLQVLLLITIIAVSVRKPWGKRVGKQVEALRAPQRSQGAV